MRFWKPGRDVAVDEAIRRYTGRSKEITTIPGKPISTGLKIWVIAQRGFFLRWVFHRPGKKGGPVGVKKPKELNKTQSVVPHLLSLLPKATYHLYCDNLFTSVKLFEYLRKLGYAATGTARTTSGVLADLVDLKKADHGDRALPWGTVSAFPTESNMVNQTGFKDSAFALAMSTVFDGIKKVLRLRRRPKETAKHAKTSRVPFGKDATKKLWIPQLYDSYNYNMGAVDLGDQLQGHNAGLRRLRRGAIQALHQFMLLVVLSNCYLILCFSGHKGKVNTRSQDDFRKKLVEALINMAKDAPGTRKRRNSNISKETFQVPVHKHKQIKMSTRSNCAACKGRRLHDHSRKRQALGEITANTGRTSTRSATFYGCKQCQVHLCDNNHCFIMYHRE